MRYPQNYPPVQLSSPDEIHIKETIYDWAHAHGLVIRALPATSGDGNSLEQAVPPSSSSLPEGVPQTTVPSVTIYPSFIPSRLYKQAVDIQVPFNELYAAVASDESWLESVLADVAETDDFLKQLWRVHQLAKDDNKTPQPVTLGLFRSDYMLNVETGEDGSVNHTLKQVEFNTIASSFGGLAVEVGNLHRYLRESGAYSGQDASSVIPLNSATSELAAGINAAHEYYKKSHEKSQLEEEAPSVPCCVLVIYQAGERNITDQKKIEYQVSAPVFRVEFNQVLTSLRLDDNRHLIYSRGSTDFQVSVVYWRAAYSPNDYKFPRAWHARLLIETSMAIKCPDVLTQLAGMKKVQQVLATPGSDELSRFLTSPELVEKVKETFVPISPLDNTPVGIEAQKLALDPNTAVDYVLKPQREGGGNNIYRDAIPEFLSKLPKEQWSSHILMQLIRTPEQHNHILRNGEVYSGPVICELGIFGTCLWSRQMSASSGKWEKVKDLILNKNAGYLVRTKPESSNEGGVAAGFGALDSCCIEDERND